MGLGFHIEAKRGAGRAGRLTTAHGEIATPVFMPVGTLATVKGVPQETLEELGVEILLSNTYHLYLRPGVEHVRRLGGLHEFMSWPRAILTDSGGFQVFSLSRLRKVREEGVEFQSHLDGSSHFLSPESATEAQMALGADIIMAFDECTEHPATRERARASMEMTLRWARRCAGHFARSRPLGEQTQIARDARKDKSRTTRDSNASYQAMFGIVQGGTYPELRRESAERTVKTGFDGYAIGGLSVGEPRELTREMVAATTPHLPPEKPRYLMGVGTPEEIVYYAQMGIDMMDCVLPTRAARHGLLFTSEGKISIKNACYAGDEEPLDAACGCRVCRRYSRAYLRHLYASNEVLATVLNTVHNLAHYLDTMRSVRHSIELGEFTNSLSGAPRT